MPANTIVSKGMSTNRYNIRTLTINDLVKDYDAVMSSFDRLKGVFGPKDTWPEGLTIEDNLIDLGWHQKEFQNKSSFAFTVMSKDEKICLGCVYINPPSKLSFDSEVILWVRESEMATGLDNHLFSTVKNWVKTDWWFNNVAYPGRDISWDDWEKSP